MAKSLSSAIGVGCMTLFAAGIIWLGYQGYRGYQHAREQRAESARLELARQQERQNREHYEQDLFDREGSRLSSIQKFVDSITTSGAPKHPQATYLKASASGLSCKRIEEILGRPDSRKSYADPAIFNMKTLELGYVFKSERLPIRSVTFACIAKDLFNTAPPTLTDITLVKKRGTETIADGLWNFVPN